MQLYLTTEAVKPKVLDTELTSVKSPEYKDQQVLSLRLTSSSDAPRGCVGKKWQLSWGLHAVERRENIYGVRDLLRMDRAQVRPFVKC